MAEPADDAPRRRAPLVVRFTDETAARLRTLLAEYPEELASAQERLRAANVVVDHEAELIEWLRADPAHAVVLLTDPAAALRAVVPELGDVDVSLAGRDYVGRLMSSGVRVDASVVVFNPPEVLAIQLLRDVANDVGARPDGYEALLADIEAVVSAVASGRYGPDIVRLTVAGIARAFGVSQAAAQPAVLDVTVPSSVLALVDQDPIVRELLATAVVREMGADDIQ